MHEGIDCQQRKKARCFVLIRHPVERFLSYYQERTAETSGMGWLQLGGFVQKYKVYSGIDSCTYSYIDMMQKDGTYFNMVSNTAFF
jgi:hypothetical protein